MSSTYTELLISAEKLAAERDAALKRAEEAEAKTETGGWKDWIDLHKTLAVREGEKIYGAARRVVAERDELKKEIEMWRETRQGLYLAEARAVVHYWRRISGRVQRISEAVIFSDVDCVYGKMHGAVDALAAKLPKEAP